MSNYEKKLIDFIKSVEVYTPRIYIDSVGALTGGAGTNLVQLQIDNKKNITTAKEMNANILRDVLPAGDSKDTVNEIINTYKNALNNWDEKDKNNAVRINNANEFSNSNFKTELEKYFSVEWKLIKDSETNKSAFVIEITGIKKNNALIPVGDTVTRAEAEAAVAIFIKKILNQKLMMHLERMQLS